MKWIKISVIILCCISMFFACKQDHQDTVKVDVIKKIDLNHIVEQLDINTLKNIDFPLRWISEYGFFVLPIHEFKPKKRVLEYAPVSSLFSDYADKSRFIWLPESTSINIVNDEIGSFDFPKGTILIKNFYYTKYGSPGASQKRKVIETRILVHEEQGWEAYPYLWNDSQTDAKLHIIGKKLPIEFTTKGGENHKINYLQPNKNQCKSCHNKSDKLVPIGPNARNLNFVYTYQDGSTENQLLVWDNAGFLGLGRELSSLPTMVDYNDTSQDIHSRAMAYLDINCGMCHHKDSPASTSGLYLTYNIEDPSMLGIYKTPVAAGKGAGNFIYDIYPSKADSSILVFRLESTEVGIQMPEIGRVTTHIEGVSIIKEWINQMD